MKFWSKVKRFFGKSGSTIKQGYIPPMEDVGKATITITLTNNEAYEFIYEGYFWDFMGETQITSAKDRFISWQERCAKRGFVDFLKNEYVPHNRIKKITVFYEECLKPCEK